MTASHTDIDRIENGASRKANDELQELREKALHTIYKTGVIVSIFTLIPSLIHYFQNGYTLVLLLETVIMCWGIAVLFVWRRLSFQVKAFGVLILFYAIGLFELLVLGPFSGGLIWFFGIGVLSSGLYGMKGAASTLLINTLTILILGVFIWLGVLTWDEAPANTLARWAVSGAAFILINTLVAMSIPVLTRGLTIAVSNKNAALALLNNHQTELEKTNTALVREVQERKVVENALRESEEGMRLIADGLPVLIAHVDANQVYRFVNKEYERWFEKSREEIVGSRVRAVLGENVYKRIKGGIETALSGVAASYDGFIELDGVGPRYFHSRNIPSYDADGSVNGYYTLVEDITEYRRYEEAIKESEEKFRSITSHALDGIIMIGPDGKISFFNKAAEKIFGYSSKEAWGCELHVLLAPSRYRPDYEKAFAEFRNTGKGPVIGKTIELAALRKDGSEFPIEMSLAALKIRDEWHAVGIMRDITKRKQAEEELRLSEEKNRKILESTAHSLTISEIDSGIIHEINQGFLHYTGYTREEVIGKSVFELNLLVEPDVRSRLVEALKNEGSIDGAAIQYRMKDGRILDGIFSARRLNYADKDCLLAVIQDVTSLRRAEYEQSMLEQQLQQAQKMEAVGTLASGIAHDFNNILQVISSYAHLIESEEKNNGDYAEYVSEIEQASRRGAELIRHILTFSREMTPNLKPVELGRIISNSVKILKHTLPRMIRIETSAPNEHCMVIADATQIEQVLVNLGTNARDAMPDGGRLMIELDCVTADEHLLMRHPELVLNTEYAVIHVRDTGLGMDQNTLTHIFEPFFSTKEIGKGTGLGLSVAYGIIQRHNGVISCQSERGKGTEFRFFIPRIAAAKEKVNEEIAIARNDPVKPLTLLLVDDEKPILKALKSVFTNFEFNVITAGSGEEALPIYRNGNGEIDAVVLDLGMPGMGGFKCLQELLKIDAGARVLVASGYADIEQEKKAIAAGAKGFISKPYRISTILNTIKEITE